MSDSFNLKAVISAVDKASPGLKKIGETARGARKYLLDIGNAASGFASKVGVPMGVLSTIAAGFSIAAIKRAMEAFGQAGESIYKGSLKAGMSVEEYQRWAYVAQQSGMEAETLTMGVGKLNRNIGDAVASKNKGLGGLMQRLKISMRGANGEIRTGSELLPALADAFSRNKNPVVQARMGVALFGKAWQEMAPLLMEGGAGIEKLQKRFKLLKSAMDLDTVKGAKEFGDQMKDLDIVTKGFQMTIAKELVPVVSPLIEEFIQWAAANRKVVASGVKEFVKDLVATLRGVDWAGVIQSVKSVGSAIMSFVDWIGGAKNALIALVIFMNMEAIAAFIGLAASAGRAVWQLGVMTVTTLPQMVTAMVPATVGLTGMAAAAGLLALKLAAISAVALAAYEGTKKLMDMTGARDWISRKISQWAGFDDEAAAAMAPTGGRRPPGPGGGGGGISLVSPQRAQVGGAIAVKFENAPPGMRIAQSEGQGGLMLNPSVGYNSQALGVPY